jgi:peptidoglycan/LPS O-acetylase OafA/YrhL
LVAAAGVSDRGSITHRYSLLLIAAMVLTSFGIALLTYLTVERIARQRLRRLFGLRKPKVTADVAVS